MTLPLHPDSGPRIQGEELKYIQCAQYAGCCIQGKGCGWYCYKLDERCFIALNEDGLREGWVWEVDPAAFENYID